MGDIASSARTIARTGRALGFDFRLLGNARSIARYVRDLTRWKRAGGRVSSLYPILGDWRTEAGDGSSAYFQQDLLVAQDVYRRGPVRHVDVGSRIDGFVAHIASFRPVEVLDIRPLESVLPNISFRRADLMALPADLQEYTDSLSCLHAIEHFGLGRYGDPIDPDGHLKGFRSLLSMLKPGGTLYLSFPVGRATVEFNAHRVFDIQDVFLWPGADEVGLEHCDVIDDRGTLHPGVVPAAFPEIRKGLVHGCAIYTLRKKLPVERTERTC